MRRTFSLLSLLALILAPIGAIAQVPWLPVIAQSAATGAGTLQQPLTVPSGQSITIASGGTFTCASGATCNTGGAAGPYLPLAGGTMTGTINSSAQFNAAGQTAVSNASNFGNIAPCATCSINFGGTSTLISTNGNGTIEVTTQAGLAGFVLNGSTDAVLAVKNRANNADAAITASVATFSGAAPITIPGGTTPLITTNTAITTGAGSGAGTLTNAPAAGNPTKWVPINDNGTTRFVPAW